MAFQQSSRRVGCYDAGMRFLPLLLLGSLPACAKPEEPAAKPAAAAPSRPAPMVTAELQASRPGIAPGETFDLGVHLTIAPGWHIYWENPGESGLKTKASFAAPAGFAVGALGYPGPSRFEGMGMTSFGYQGATLLLAPVTAPADLAAGTRPRFSAEVSWLACKDACVPGKKSLALELEAVPAGGTVAPPGELFARFTSRLPRPLGSLTGASVARSATPQGVEVTLRLPVAPEAATDFFPGPSASLDLASSAVEPGDGTRVLRLAFRRLEGSPDPGPGEPGGVVRVGDGEQALYYDIGGIAPAGVEPATP
jgi:thiol:disulfide interchange protein DsbD